MLEGIAIRNSNELPGALGLRDTEFSQAQCDTIRVKLLKIGATIQVSVRRVVLALSEAFPFQTIFQQAWENLRQLGSMFAFSAGALQHPPASAF